MPSDVNSYGKQLTLEQIEGYRRELIESSTDECHDDFNALCDMALASLRGPSRDEVIEECAKALEPANHPMLMAAVKTIRALSNATESEDRNG